MSLCCEEMLKALQEDDNSCKIIPHHEEYTLDEVLKMFEDKNPKHHMIRLSNGEMVDSSTLL